MFYEWYEYLVPSNKDWNKRMKMLHHSIMGWLGLLIMGVLCLSFTSNNAEAGLATSPIGGFGIFEIPSEDAVADCRLAAGDVLECRWRLGQEGPEEFNFDASGVPQSGPDYWVCSETGGSNFECEPGTGASYLVASYEGGSPPRYSLE